MRQKRTAVRPSRGSALVTVILVVLILTVVGVGIAYFTQMEDRLSGNTRIMRSALYAADAGLRRGEMVISAHTYGGFPLDLLLTYGGAVPPLIPPGGGAQAVMLRGTDPEDAADKDFVNIVIPVPGGVVDRGTYSLYVRNNQEDVLGSATDDKDNIINLISVGRIDALGGSYTKILEEQLIVGKTGVEFGGQKDQDAGGTGSANTS